MLFSSSARELFYRQIERERERYQVRKYPSYEDMLYFPIRGVWLCDSSELFRSIILYKRVVLPLALY